MRASSTCGSSTNAGSSSLAYANLAFVKAKKLAVSIALGAILIMAARSRYRVSSPPSPTAGWPAMRGEAIRTSTCNSPKIFITPPSAADN